MKHTSIAVLACLFMVSAAHAQIPGGGFTTSAIAQLEYSAIPSTAIGTDGLALIAYRSPQGVVVAHCSNPACSVAVATVVDNAAVPYNSPIVIGSDGRGLVSHGDGGITVAHCNDVACTSATTTLLDPGGGGWVAATVGADGLGLDRLPPGCLRPANGRSLLQRGLLGRYLLHLRTVHGHPHARGYREGAFQGRSLRVAHCNDVPCTSATHVPIDIPDQNSSTSIAIGRDGLPLVAYLTGFDLTTAHQAPRGDFNTDGRQDLVWRRDGSGDNMVWFMNAADLMGASFTNPSTLADANRKIVGTNDFNDDAQTDLLWRHATSGENAVWFMNGVNLVSGTFTTPTSLADVHWQTVGTGDFNRDGKPDILWHQQTSGQVVVWYMDGPLMTGGTFTNPAAVPDIGWKVAAVGDYNADARQDIVWHHQASGQNAIWFMDNATLISGTFTNPSTFPDTNWKLVGPR